MLTRVTFLNGGHCVQLARLAGRRAWRWDKFHAVFVYLEHSVHGPALVDTGYSERFLTATRSFPERLYRWLTPVTLPAGGGPAAVLRKINIDPRSVRTIFVSHFHGDHIAGLGDFPEARFVYRSHSLDELRRHHVWSQVRHGFLAGLLPADFDARGDSISEDRFQPGADRWHEFRTLDYWGDGSIVLVDLPGHAEGHTGYVLDAPDGAVFYIVDATWDVDVMLAGRGLPWPSRGFQYSYADYLQTQEKLRRLTEISMLACHCPRTQPKAASC